MEQAVKNVQDIAQKGLCIGCGACYSACPYGCIESQNGRDGYPVPSVILCRGCRACLEDCPGAG